MDFQSFLEYQEAQIYAQFLSRRVHCVLYYYNPVGYDFLPHCGGKRKFNDVEDQSLYIILTYKAKPIETTTKKNLLVSSHLPSKHIGHRHFQIEIFISMRRTGKRSGYLYNFISCIWFSRQNCNLIFQETLSSSRWVGDIIA